MSLKEFQILSELGSGSYSQVYKVKRLEDGQVYALKKVRLAHASPRERINALNETHILAAINHKNVIRYHEAFVDSESTALCTVMEYADRGDLLQRIKQHERSGTLFPEREIWKVFREVLQGLAALHGAQVLHRDIKSANIFLSSSDEAKIGDLNVAKKAENGLLSTQTGTPFYASPEVWEDRPYGFKSDIWSLGCVVYEMAALKPPFQASSMQELFLQVKKGKYPPLPPVYSSDLHSIVKSMIQINPHLRPSCTKLIERLRNSGKMEESLGDALASPMARFTLGKNIECTRSLLPSPRYSSVRKKIPRILSMERIEVSPPIETPTHRVSRLPSIFRSPPLRLLNRPI